MKKIEKTDKHKVNINKNYSLINLFIFQSYKNVIL